MSESAFQQGYNDSVAGNQPYPAKVEENDRDTYMCGYRAAARGLTLYEESRDFEIKQAAVTVEIDDKRRPQTEIILTIDAESYLRHYNEMEGELEDLANMLRHDAVKAISEMDLAPLVFDLVVGQGKYDITTTIGLKDKYVELAIDCLGAVRASGRDAGKEITTRITHKQGL